MTAVKFYWAWFKLGRDFWKAQQELQKIAEDCVRFATLAAYLNQSTGSVADEVEAWLSNHEDEA